MGMATKNEPPQNPVNGKASTKKKQTNIAEPY